MTDSARAATGHGRLRTRRHVRGFLDDLGRTGDEVAETLAALGVRGVRSQPGDCPMARLLAAVVGSDPAVARVRVWNRHVLVTKAGGWRWVFTRLPGSVRDFVGAFDAGRHPQLMRAATSTPRGEGQVRVPRQDASPPATAAGGN